MRRRSVGAFSTTRARGSVCFFLQLRRPRGPRLTRIGSDDRRRLSWRRRPCCAGGCEAFKRRYGGFFFLRRGRMADSLGKFESGMTISLACASAVSVQCPAPQCPASTPSAGLCALLFHSLPSPFPTSLLASLSCCDVWLGPPVLLLCQTGPRFLSATTCLQPFALPAFAVAAPSPMKCLYPPADPILQRERQRMVCRRHQNKEPGTTHASAGRNIIIIFCLAVSPQGSIVCHSFLFLRLPNHLGPA